ncbi:MAG TPA: aminotransferase class I/II-fold pyridoxal phosphate-dependent enzyme, partial [Acidimicrobiia bacterium]|nr:aminotransferase class I/II-fold pyridoxal phosphate-dependent enzyme [Acidimicrobiia bacterium]
NFGSNNYLSLSYHPKVIEAAQAATQRYGTGVTGSRLLNGTLDLHRTLEAELAEFYEREAALVFSTGYVANVSTISGLLNRHDFVVLDKDAHNSLLTGAQLSGATMKRFGHNDIERLTRILDDLPAEPGKGVVVDGVYSMGGDTAPLAELVELCHRYPNTFLLDDEAHGLGVLGARGRGAAEQYGVLDTVDLVTITFSKTLGSCGGALIGSADAIELLTLDADPLIFTASNTPGSVAAALEALRILRATPEMTDRLRDNVERFVGLLTERGVPVNPAESAIITIPLRQRDEVSAVVLARELLDAGVFVNPVVAPAVPRGLGLIRLSLMLEHTPALLEEAAETIYKVLDDADQLPEDV